jgi:hypothetical protein
MSLTDISLPVAPSSAAIKIAWDVKAFYFHTNSHCGRWIYLDISTNGFSITGGVEVKDLQGD